AAEKHSWQHSSKALTGPREHPSRGQRGAIGADDRVEILPPLSVFASLPLLHRQQRATCRADRGDVQNRKAGGRGERAGYRAERVGQKEGAESMSAGIPLPPADITRWTRHRKAEVVEAVRRERIPLAAAMRRWGISEKNTA